MKSESSKIFTKTHDIAADLGISLQEYFNNGSDEREETKRFLDDVKNAYRNLSKELHPDANVAIPEEAVDICKRLFIKIEKSKQEIDQLAKQGTALNVRALKEYKNLLSEKKPEEKYDIKEDI